jgi:hypothetical protein
VSIKCKRREQSHSVDFAHGNQPDIGIRGCSFENTS